MDLQQEVWPTEDFELVTSLVQPSPRGRPVRRDQGTCDTGFMNSVVLLVSASRPTWSRSPTRSPPTTRSAPVGGTSLLFVALAGAVTFLGFSLSKQLRKTRTNAERGVFDDRGKPAH